MPIFYAIIARGSQIVAKCASSKDDYDEVAKDALADFNRLHRELTRCRYKYRIHYVYENRITFMCITDENFEHRVAFAFLHEMREQFQRRFLLPITHAGAYMANMKFSPFMEDLRQFYSNLKSNRRGVE